tara:strand:+ start:216 stop:728 length:513 start_codon:yes stop_codon:yes gene_type:complete
VIKKVLRYYLEIKSLKDLNEVLRPSDDYNINFVDRKNFQLNKFLYKQIGKKYRWVDRLAWTEYNWISYTSNNNTFTYVLKKKEDLVGYFELLFHESKKEIEIVYFGLLEEYFGKKLGGYLLSEAIKKSFLFKIDRIWVHTCSLDHDYALKNYITRGMKIYKEENISVEIV